MLRFTNTNGEAACRYYLCRQGIYGKNIMGLPPRAKLIGDPQVDVAENSLQLNKYHIFVEILRDSLKKIDAQITFD